MSDKKCQHCGGSTFSDTQKIDAEGNCITTNLKICVECKTLKTREIPIMRLYQKNELLRLEFFWEGRFAEAQKFQELVFTTMPKETGWFHQGGFSPDTDWRLFEFWTVKNQLPIIRRVCSEIAKELKVLLTEEIF